jgi:hypothetical protein
MRVYVYFALLATQDIAEHEPTMHIYATHFCSSPAEWTESGPTTESERNGFDMKLLPFGVQGFTSPRARVHLLLRQRTRDAAWRVPGVMLAMRFQSCELPR